MNFLIAGLSNVKGVHHKPDPVFVLAAIADEKEQRLCFGAGNQSVSHKFPILYRLCAGRIRQSDLCAGWQPDGSGGTGENRKPPQPTGIRQTATANGARFNSILRNGKQKSCALRTGMRLVQSFMQRG